MASSARRSLVEDTIRIEMLDGARRLIFWGDRANNETAVASGISRRGLGSPGTSPIRSCSRRRKVGGCGRVLPQYGSSPPSWTTCGEIVHQHSKACAAWVAARHRRPSPTVSAEAVKKARYYYFSDGASVQIPKKSRYRRIFATVVHALNVRITGFCQNSIFDIASSHCQNNFIHAI